MFHLDKAWFTLPEVGHDSFGLKIWSDDHDLISKMRLWGEQNLLRLKKDHPNYRLRAILQSFSEDFFYFEFFGYPGSSASPEEREFAETVVKKFAREFDIPFEVEEQGGVNS